MADKRTTLALKDVFNGPAIRHIADEADLVCPGFNSQHFLVSSANLDQLPLMARVRRVAESLHAALPGTYQQNVDALYGLAPRLQRGFTTLALPEYVALYGADHFETSMKALKFFTTFGSSEYAVRHFLQRDLSGTLAVMETWAHDDNEHVRRLASEGSRPRLPWSFHINALKLDPTPLGLIVDTLKEDPSLYVRRSVANNLNDITKDNPAWVLDRIEGWPHGNARTVWIVKHALRSLIKKGDRRALAVIGAGSAPQVKLSELSVSPSEVRLGQEIELTFTLSSTANETQRLVLDYKVYYVKKSGAVSAKVFKLKTLALGKGAFERVRKRQLIADFTTRTHYPGRHEIQILINGEVHGRAAFELLAS